ncbi:MAG: deoxynucleoside kinase [Neisseriales bacterium]|nr:MAG: deoxynucleoside kinase [Neisseriales bacterium]
MTIKPITLPFDYIVVEGTIGAGKSELAKRLVDYYHATFIKERPEDNPFLLRFYSNTGHLALATQLAFLQQRIAMAQNMFAPEMATSKIIVSDFLFEKDAIFAKMILDDDELSLYRYIVDQIAPRYPVPKLVIYLQVSEDMVKRRIAARGDEYEKIFPEGYLSRIQVAYSTFFHHYNASPLLIVNTDNLIFSRDEDFYLLLQYIAKNRSVRSYFNKN